MRWSAIWSSPIDSAGTVLMSSAWRRLSNELIPWKTSPEVQLPRTPLTEHMFVVYRKYVWCQGFCDVNLRTSLLRHARHLAPPGARQLLFPSPFWTRISPPGVLAARARRPPRVAGRRDTPPCPPSLPLPSLWGACDSPPGVLASRAGRPPRLVGRRDQARRGSGRQRPSSSRYPAGISGS